MSFLFLLVLCTHANSACNRQWNFYTSMTLWVILQGDPAVRYREANLCYSLIMTSKNRRKRTISVASRKLVYAQLLTGGLWMEFVKFFWLFGVFFSIEHTVRKKKITFIQNFVEKSRWNCKCERRVPPPTDCDN